MCAQVCACAGRFINKIFFLMAPEAGKLGHMVLTCPLSPEAESVPLGAPSRPEEVIFSCRGRDGRHVKEPDCSCQVQLS